jgi:hypothetical protein
VAGRVYERCVAALEAGASASTAFAHKHKTAAMDTIWAERHALFEKYSNAHDPMLVLAELPFIGPVTVYHLAKNFGSDTAKPDVHMERLARRENTTTHKLCRRLANQTGYRIATIDSVLWRACELKILESDVYEQHGWRAAFTRKARRQATPQPQADAPFTKQQGAEDPETGSDSRTPSQAACVT